MEAHDTFTFPSHSAAVESSPSTQHVEVPAKRARTESTEDEPFSRDQSLKCPTSIALQAALPSEPASPIAPILEERSNSLPGPIVPPQSPITEDGRRQRSNSLPLPVEEVAASVRSLGKRRAPNPVPAPAPKLAPLSQHQLLALHQLRRPRPSYNALSRTSVAHSGIGAAASLSIPALTPPINRTTLRELDLAEILRNPQLRHDIVFDPHLMFRPNTDGGDKKRELADRYWLALAAEVERGCRCSTWGPIAGKGGETEVLDCVCAAAGLASSALNVLLQGGRDRMVVDGQGSARPVMAAAPLAARLPSRIPPLVAELKAILLSLLPAPSQQHGVGSAEQISAALDEDLIAQEVTHGVLDVGALARFLGATLKMHCAPMRDEAVDKMVVKVEEGQVAGGLKACFEMLELMKLDIANHQLRTLRPFLLETALDFELKNLYDVHERPTNGGHAFERTTTWFEEATTRCGSEHVATAISDGLLELAFSPDHLAPALPQRGSSRRSSSPSLILPAPMANQIPETFHLDLHRLQGFHADVTDLTVLCLLILLYRQLCASTGHSPSEEEIELVRHECWILIASPTSALLPPSTTTTTANITEREAAIAALAVAGPGAGLRKLDHPDWRNNLRDAALQLIRHLPAVTVPSTEQLALVGGWLDSNIRMGSDLFTMVQKRLRCRLGGVMEQERVKMMASYAALLGVLSPTVVVKEEVADTPTGCVRRGNIVNASMMAGKRRHVEDEEEEPSAKRRRSDDTLEEGRSSPPRAATTEQTMTCLLPLDKEIRALATRMAKVTAVHLKVYAGWYAALLASGEPPGLIVHDEVRASTTAMMHGRGS